MSPRSLVFVPSEGMEGMVQPGLFGALPPCALLEGKRVLVLCYEGADLMFGSARLGQSMKKDPPTEEELDSVGERLFDLTEGLDDLPVEWDLPLTMAVIAEKRGLGSIVITDSISAEGAP